MNNLFEKYTKDNIRAIDAKFEAQKIAFAPLVFQAVNALLELGVLKTISDAAEEGITAAEICKKTNLSEYAAEVLLEMALGVNLIKILPENENNETRFILGKTGWFFLEDNLTKANLNFVNDVCYKGAFELTRSLKEGKPCGLKVFTDNIAAGGRTSPVSTIYEALSELPRKVRESWFAFDHFYSDISFEEALPVVFNNEKQERPKKIIDIGGNTAKWAIQCCRHDPDTEVLIIDLPGQIKVAEKNVEEAGFSGRISVLPCNVLDSNFKIPGGAGVIWMSQFLDCFSAEDISVILKKVKEAASILTDVYILEPFWDKQRFEAAAFSLQATSLYFTCMANGKSKMYRYDVFKDIIEKSGFEICHAHHNLGSNDYSLLHCRRKFQ